MTSPNPDQPITPGEDVHAGQPDGQPNEIDPGRLGDNTEVDLDKTKIPTYPNPDNEPPRK